MASTKPNLSFGVLAIGYALAYAAAAGLDHMTTRMAIEHGMTESNAAFRTGSGGLASGLGIGAMAALLPAMLGLLWLACRRQNSPGRNVPDLVAQLIGRTPAGAALFPIVLVLAKALIGVLTAMHLIIGWSPLDLLADGLHALKLQAGSTYFAVSAGLILVCAYYAGKRIAALLFPENATAALQARER